MNERQILREFYEAWWSLECATGNWSDHRRHLARFREAVDAVREIDGMHPLFGCAPELGDAFDGPEHLSGAVADDDLEAILDDEPLEDLLGLLVKNLAHS